MQHNFLPISQDLGISQFLDSSLLFVSLFDCNWNSQSSRYSILISQRTLILARVLKKPVEAEFDGDEAGDYINDAASAFELGS